MTTRVTVKGQVTLPKSVREAAGIKPGDQVEVRNTAAGVIIEKSGKKGGYRTKLEALAKRRLIRNGLTTDEMMIETRGDPADDPRLS